MVTSSTYKAVCDAGGSDIQGLPFSFLFFVIEKVGLFELQNLSDGIGIETGEGTTPLPAPTLQPGPDGNKGEGRSSQSERELTFVSTLKAFQTRDLEVKKNPGADQGKKGFSSRKVAVPLCTSLQSDQPFPLPLSSLFLHLDEWKKQKEKKGSRQINKNNDVGLRSFGKENHSLSMINIERRAMIKGAFLLVEVNGSQKEVGRVLGA